MLRFAFYNLIFLCFTQLATPAIASEPGVTDHEIQIGTSIPLTGPSSAKSKKLLEGEQLYFKRVNAAGGVAGRKINLVIKDDSYDPVKSAQNSQELVEADHVFALLGFFGTPTIKASLPIIKKYEVPVVAPTSGAMFLRQPPDPNIYTLKASVFDEVESMVEFLLKRGSTRIGVFFQDDAFGQEAKNGAQKALAKRGMQLVSAGGFARNSDQIDAAYAELVKGNPDGVIVYGLGKSCVDFVNRAEREKLGATLVLGSALLTDEMASGTAGLSKPLFAVTGIPLPESDQRTLTRDYIRDSKAAGIAPNQNGLEGYLGAAVLKAALEKAGKELTRSGLRDAFNQKLNGFDLGGYRLEFSPSQHQALSEIRKVVIHGGKIKLLKE